MRFSCSSKSFWGFIDAGEFSRSSPTSSRLSFLKACSCTSYFWCVDSSDGCESSEATSMPTIWMLCGRDDKKSSSYLVLSWLMKLFFSK